jgi:hypothetical protein
MTDGRVRKEMVLVFAGGARPTKEIGELIRAGIWLEAGGFYELRDWAQHNITREAWDAKKEEKRQLMAKWRASRKPTGGASVVDHETPTRMEVSSSQTKDEDEDEGRGREIRSRSDQISEDLITSRSVLTSSRAREPEAPVGLPAVPETHTPSSPDPAEEHPARQLRRVFNAHHEKARTTLVLFANLPKRLQASARVADWLVETCKRAGVPYDDGAARLVGNYFASAKGQRFEFGWDFFASCPEEFWNADSASSEQDRIKIQVEIDQLTEERRAAYRRNDDARATALGKQIAELNARLPRGAPDVGRSRGGRAAQR